MKIRNSGAENPYLSIVFPVPKRTRISFVRSQIKGMPGSKLGCRNFQSRLNWHIPLITFTAPRPTAVQAQPTEFGDCYCNSDVHETRWGGCIVVAGEGNEHCHGMVILQ